MTTIFNVYTLSSGNGSIISNSSLLPEIPYFNEATPPRRICYDTHYLDRVLQFVCVWLTWSVLHCHLVKRRWAQMAVRVEPDAEHCQACHMSETVNWAQNATVSLLAHSQQKVRTT